jgi:predicted nuclease with TOPRIM domain
LCYFGVVKAFIVTPSLEIKLLREENDKLRKENRQLKEDFKLLLTKVASLEERLSHYENQKKQ